MPVKVEQINEYLLSDTVQSQKARSGSDEICQGQDRGYPSKCSLEIERLHTVKSTPAYNMELNNSVSMKEYAFDRTLTSNTSETRENTCVMQDSIDQVPTLNDAYH